MDLKGSGKDKSSFCTGRDSNWLPAAHKSKAFSSISDFCLCADLWRVNLAMLLVLHRYGASDVSMSMYDELEMLRCKGSGRGLFSNKISVFTRKFRESPVRRYFS
jgi:hypothetical protein